MAQDVQLDGVDRRILDVLTADGRTSVNALAATVNVSRASAYQRLARLRERGVIRRFTVDVDPHALGLPIAALVLVSVEQHSWRQAGEQLRRLPGVEWLAYATGDFDFAVLVRAEDVAHLRDVVLGGFQSIAEVRSTRTIFLLDEPEPAPDQRAPHLPATPRGAVP